MSALGAHSAANTVQLADHKGNRKTKWNSIFTRVQTYVGRYCRCDAQRSIPFVTLQDIRLGVGFPGFKDVADSLDWRRWTLVTILLAWHHEACITKCVPINLVG